MTKSEIGQIRRFNKNETMLQNYKAKHFIIINFKQSFDHREECMVKILENGTVISFYKSFIEANTTII